MKEKRRMIIEIIEKNIILQIDFVSFILWMYEKKGYKL